ncbi:MAG: alpha/beta hydrolase [Spirochaetales bacterium]|nr:alpha/beta hydrolase [Spirochaetales bacterium]
MPQDNHQTEEFLNNEYNPRLRVPDHLSVMHGWKKKSAQARKHSDCELDARYGEEKNETIDIFYPSVRGDAPVLFFIHGGYWRGLDKGDFSFLAPPFTESGAAVFMPNYALAPSVSIAQITDQVAGALEWTYLNAGEYGCNPDRIFIAGHSAGAHLAVMMMTSGRKSGRGIPLSQIVKGCAAVSGIYDLSPLVYTGFLKDDLKLDEKTAAEVSPVNMRPAGGAPLYTCVGGSESGEFLRQTAMLREKWKEVLKGDIPMPGYNHFNIVDAVSDPGSPLFKVIHEMLSSL